MDGVLLVSGIVLLCSGVAIRYWVNRRQFYRRGPGGLQHYDNYEKAVGTSCLEKLARLIAFILIVSGFLLAGMYFFNRKYGSVEQYRKAGENSEKSNLK